MYRPIVTTGFIYKITNIDTNKVYIGKSTYKNLKRLIKRYVSEAQSKRDRYIIRAIRKYGINNFIFEVIEENILLNNIDDREKHYINKFNSNNKNIGYNLTLGGEGAPGLKWSEESKKLMSTIKKGVYAGEKNYFYGKPLDEEARNRVIESNKRRRGKPRRPHTEEAKKNISKSHMGQVAWNKGKEYFQIKGDKNPNYRYIDKNILCELIKYNYSYKEICYILDISITCFYAKLKEFNLRGIYDEYKQKNGIHTTG